MRIVTPTGAGLLAYDASSGGSYIFSLTRTSGVHSNDLNIGALNGFAISTGVSAVPSSSYDFYINSSGNVGIGTTSPAAKLTIADGGSAAGARILDIGDDSYLTDVDSANTLGVYGIQNSTIGSIKLGSTGGSISGYDYNIGINQASPAYRLDVGGTGRFTGTVVVPLQPLVIMQQLKHMLIPCSLIRSMDSFRSNVYVTSTSNNVGIGTTSPSQKLTVAGNILASNGTVSATNFHDSNGVFNVNLGGVMVEAWLLVILVAHMEELDIILDILLLVLSTLHQEQILFLIFYFIMVVFNSMELLQEQQDELYQ